MERNVKYLIIGAGISGLTFANYADGALNVKPKIITL